MKYFFLLFIVISIQVKASNKRTQGEVIVLEAPLFLKPNLKSKIVEYVRKGKLLYIHPFSFRNDLTLKGHDIDDSTLNWIEDDRHLRKEDIPFGLKNNFYVTVDKLGRTAYVPQAYVKLIYNNARELDEYFFPLKKDDTDYRLKEPLPQNYPLPVKTGYRAFGMMSFSGQARKHYPYTNSLINSEQTIPLEFYAVFLRHGLLFPDDFKKINKRFFFGFHLAISANQQQLQLADLALINENRQRFAAGPYLSYDVYQDAHNRLGLFFGTFFNFERVHISQTKDIREIGFNTRFHEERNFQGLFFSGRFGTLYQRLKILNGPLDFIAGVSIDLTLPHSLEPKSENKNTLLWRNDSDDKIISRFHAAGNFHLGLQISI